MGTHVDYRLYEKLETAIRNDNCIDLVAIITATEIVTSGKVKTIRLIPNSLSTVSSTGTGLPVSPPQSDKSTKPGHSDLQRQCTEAVSSDTYIPAVSELDSTNTHAKEYFETYLTNPSGRVRNETPCSNTNSLGVHELERTSSALTDSQNIKLAGSHPVGAEQLHTDRPTDSSSPATCRTRDTEEKHDISEFVSSKTVKNEDSSINASVKKRTLIHSDINQILMSTDEKFWRNMKQKIVTIFHSKLGLGLWMLSIEQNSFHCVRFLLKHGQNVDVVDGGRRKTALMLAAQNGNIQLLQLLLSFGAKVDVKTKCLTSPALVYAATMGHAQCVRSLLLAGAKVNKTSVFCPPPLVAAAENGSTECLNLLLKFGADVNCCEKSGKTALMYASQRGHVDSVTCLCSAGAAVNKEDVLGKTALMYAASDDALCVRRLLQAGADKRIRDKERGKTAMIYAAENGNLECLKLLSSLSANGYSSYGMTKGTLSDTDGQTGHCLPTDSSEINSTDVFYSKTALMYAAQGGRVNSVQFLIESGADINAQDVTKSTALIHATYALCNAMHYDVPSLTADIDRHSQSVQLLLKSGASAAVSNDHMDSAISLAFIPDSVKNLRKRLKILLPFARYQPELLTFVKRKAAEHKTHHYPVMLILVQIIFQTDPALIFEDPHPWSIFTTCHDIKLSSLSGCGFSPSLSAFLHNRLDIARYLIANSVFTSPDGNPRQILSQARQAYSSITCVYTKSDSLLRKMYSEPWPLVKLALIAVSTLINNAASRREAIASSGLPDKIQRILAFEEATVRLCPSQWSSLPLEFDPTSYDRLPRSRPLLYNWPIGRALEECRCDECGSEGVKYVSTHTTV